MYCSNCGEPITEKTKFCPYCGMPVGEETEVSAFSGAAPQWESKSYTVRCVPPDFETVKDVTAKFEAFGWELYSSQKITDKDVDVEVSRHEVRTTTTTDSSTHLVFRRNKKMPHYKEIVELEEMYDDADLKCINHTPYNGGCSLYLGIIGIIVGLCFVEFPSMYGYMFLCWLIAAPFIAFSVKKFKEDKILQEKAKANRAKYEPIKKDCLEKVRNYIH